MLVIDASLAIDVSSRARAWVVLPSIWQLFNSWIFTIFYEIFLDWELHRELERASIDVNLFYIHFCFSSYKNCFNKNMSTPAARGCEDLWPAKNCQILGPRGRHFEILFLILSSRICHVLSEIFLICSRSRDLIPSMREVKSCIFSEIIFLSGF